MKKRLIVLSDSKDSYRNHAVEEILFTSYVDYEQILFLWVNEPSVVFGRNQNPWREIDIRFTKEQDIKMIRRLSGGGTVYHDLGNLNYSFIERHGLYDEAAHFQIIIDALKTFGVSLELSARKDLSLNGNKVSGSAFYLKGMRRIHHGTLLIDADLEVLWKSIKVNDALYKSRFIESRSIASVPSPVANLNQVVQGLKVPDVINALVDTFYAASAYEVEHLPFTEIMETNARLAQKIIERLKSWAWIFGETPKFSYKDEHGVTYEVVNGSVVPDGNINPIFQEDNYVFRKF